MQSALQLRGSRGAACASLFIVASVLVVSAGCEKSPPPPPTPPAPPKGAPASQPASKPSLTLTPAMKALATQPAGAPTGLFLDRKSPTDLRLMNYNVNWDSIFPDKNRAHAEKYQRLLKVLDPDVLSLQEFKDKTAADVVTLMNAIDPLPAGRTWYAYEGQGNVIAAKWPLSKTADHTTPPSYRDPATALVDLPNDRFPVDLYVVDVHFKCCSKAGDQERRQGEADALINWTRDARTAGGEIDLPEGTPIVIAGDLNLVEGPEPLTTILTGDIHDESKFGPDFPPDWDVTPMTDVHPLHNGVGPDDYTWRNDSSEFKPARMDFVIYTDSVLAVAQSFVLNTMTMSDADLAKAHLQKLDVSMDAVGKDVDHLPVIVDFRLATH